MQNNTVVLEGNITRDPEMQFSKAGNGYTRNTLAVERRRKDGDEWVSDTSFIDFSILDDKMAENFCESITKGARVLIVGAIQTRTVPVNKDEPDGEKRTYTGVIVENVGASLRWATAAIVKNEKGSTASSSSASGDDFFDQ